MLFRYVVCKVIFKTIFNKDNAQ